MGGITEGDGTSAAWDDYVDMQETENDIPESLQQPESIHKLAMLDETSADWQDGELIYKLPLSKSGLQVDECEPIDWDSVSIITDEALFEVWGNDRNYINQMSPWAAGRELKPVELVSGDDKYSAVIQNDDTYIVKGNPVTGEPVFYMCRGQKAVSIDYSIMLTWGYGKIWTYDVTGDGYDEYIVSHSETSMGETRSYVYIIDTHNLRVLEYEDTDSLVIEMAEEIVSQYLSDSEKVDGYSFYLAGTGNYTYAYYTTGEEPRTKRVVEVVYGPTQSYLNSAVHKRVGTITIYFQYSAEDDRMMVSSYEYK